jgi:hypothetical protein
MNLNESAVGICGIAASLIVGLAGIVVAALSYYLSYKERISSIRGELYSKRLDSYAEIMETMFRLYHDIRFAIIVMNLRLD